MRNRQGWCARSVDRAFVAFEGGLLTQWPGPRPSGRVGGNPSRAAVAAAQLLQAQVTLRGS